jgi:hypothetical protein
MAAYMLDDRKPGSVGTARTMDSASSAHTRSMSGPGAGVAAAAGGIPAPGAAPGAPAVDGAAAVAPELSEAASEHSDDDAQPPCLRS